ALLGLFIAQPFASDNGDNEGPVDPSRKKGPAPPEQKLPLKEVRQLTGHTSEVLCVALAPDGRYALSGGKDHSVRLWNVGTGLEVRRCVGHSQAIACVVFAPKGSRALSGGEDRIVILWDVDTGRELSRYEGHK